MLTLARRPGQGGRRRGPHTPRRRGGSRDRDRRHRVRGRADRPARGADPDRAESRTVGAAGVPVTAKLELLQRTGSFKVRGAAAKLLSLSEAERAAGVVAVSGGNHGISSR
ncbi:hypothetical protein SHKM778_40310 [Streptomyces sp. KM77-8]|uniref:Tryptophan synthase beta chain-like PALP domain-containing protein n=1 Tax=Streptomyces haneummycinicus TaxID=3074435 RepID=A0AAT9HJV4_9ACTN